MVLSNASVMIFEKEDVPDEGLDIDLCEKPSSFVFENCDFKLNVKKCNCPDLHEIDPRLAPLEKLKNLKERS